MAALHDRRAVPLSTVERADDIDGMSLGIVLKGSEGIVLAADSRVTLFAQAAAAGGMPPMVVPANFDNATKVLRIARHKHVGAVTYGVGVIATATGPRTMHSFIPEFEAELKSPAVGRLTVNDFASQLSTFYLDRFTTLNTVPLVAGNNIEFIVGGYDDGDAYGKMFQFRIPSEPAPVERNAAPGEFGIVWGGQGELVHRLLKGYDANIIGFLQQELALNPSRVADLTTKLGTRFPATIPFQFLPLQDCVDIAMYLIQGTIDFQRFNVGIRGVGGRVAVATITPISGFHWVSRKNMPSTATLDSEEHV
jgi:hypothetical protein